MHDKQREHSSGSEVTYPIVKIAGRAGKHENNERSVNQGGDKMTTMKALAIVHHNMTEKEFMEHWATIYPQHCFGGYNEEQYTLWTTNPFEFVAKWPVISHYLINHYS